MSTAYEYDDRGIETDESFDRRMEETYRPDPARPWRVSWGFGAFEDFESEEQARSYYETLPEDGWLRQEPFNAVEAWT